MFTGRTIEFEQGTESRRLHRHNGYYAGDFSARRHLSRDALNDLTRDLTALRRPPWGDPR